MTDKKIRTRQELEEKIKEIFEVDSISLLISKQISTYVTERHDTYLDIGRALFYFYEIKNGDKSKCSGIGIVPYVIEESRAYFQELERQIARQKEEAKAQKENETRIIICKSPREKREKIKKINIENIKEEKDG